MTAPADPWRHDLTATSRFTELWPFLLVLALLLWPLDIALRRVSVGRREFAAAGAWVRGMRSRRRRVAVRTAASEGLLAARERATSASTRAALRAEPIAADGSVARASATSPSPAPVSAPTVAPSTPHPSPAPAPTGPTSAAAPVEPTTPASADTLARLRDAKRRARER